MDPLKRNYILMFTDSVLFTNAMTFLSINAIITYFLNSLGASTFEIGLANALVSIGAFISQPVYARKVMNLSYKRDTFVKILLTQRVFFLLFIMLIPFFAVDYPRFTVVLFLFGWAVFNYFVGAYGSFYMSLFAKMVAVQQRGKLKGFSGGFGSLLALGTAYLGAVLLRDVPYPYNYTLVFACGILLLLLDACVFALMKEEPDAVTPIDIKYFQYFKAIPQVMGQNRRFKNIVIGFCFMLVSQVSLVYYALFAVRVYEITPSQVALFTGITAMINIVGSILFGILADLFSHRLILLISSLSAAAAGILVVSVHHLAAVYVAFALTSLCLSGYNLSSGILIIENVRHDKIPISISINSLITMLVSAAVTLGSSFLIDWLSFSSVFLVAGISGLLGAAVLYAYNGGKEWRNRDAGNAVSVD